VFSTELTPLNPGEELSILFLLYLEESRAELIAKRSFITLGLASYGHARKRTLVVIIFCNFFHFLAHNWLYPPSMNIQAMKAGG
jgi:hypothetical protein